MRVIALTLTRAGMASDKQQCLHHEDVGERCQHPLKIKPQKLMWKSPMSVALVISSLAIVTLFWFTKTRKASSATAEQTMVSAPISLSDNVPKAAEARSPEMKDALDAMDANYAHAAEIFTPVVRKMISEASKATLKSKYQTLFTKWKLEPESAENVLSLIYQRDEAINNARYKLNEAGRSGLREFQWAEFNEMHMTRFQLELILGSERTAELCRMETERKFENMARATGLSKEVIRQRMSSSVRSPSNAQSTPDAFKRK